MKLYLNKITLSEVKQSIERNFKTFVLTNKDESAKPTLRIYLSNDTTFKSRNELMAILD